MRRRLVNKSSSVGLAEVLFDDFLKVTVELSRRRLVARTRESDFLQQALFQDG